MILEIRFSNFFSIKDEVILDLRAGNSKSQHMKELESNVFAYKDEKILKAVAIYGANASGKSNIIKAIRFCCSMILQSHLNNENVVFLFTPFKFEGYSEKPSTFSIRFVINGIEYEYSYSLTRKMIKTESLFYYPNDRRAKVFTRDERIEGEKKDKYSFGSGIKRPMDVAENTSDKTLFISRASQMDRELGKEIFRFFNEQLLLGYTGFNAPNIESLIADNKQSLIAALQIADSDIVDIKTRKRTVPFKSVDIRLPASTATVNDIQQEMIQVITNHKASPGIAFDLASEESAGTKNLFMIILSLFDIVKNNKILLIDEIELSLHSRIVEFIIKLFYISHSAQLIFTTHNTKLLDLEKIRKDQIYFVNKKPDASTDLYSLFDYKDFRDTMDVEKAYLQGRFDAIPFVDDSIANLKSLIHG
ncbi:MAG: ATPase [Bacteroidetes bacterium GWA2_40_15]|nr:MAG: ATPase [Bacteroidetes bacterium GWA2_40_15]OFX90317.1 MAG: ATPase [Bacteroidetes bacterium GWC2_40_22]HBH84643.1 ATPase [Bacteroidales bacterium]HCU18452.1 ATPase [Bacteroidales bacterium]